MPSHQDRVKQNYCEHIFPPMDHFFMEMDIPDGRKCIKCGIDWDKVHRKPKK